MATKRIKDCESILNDSKTFKLKSQSGINISNPPELFRRLSEKRYVDQLKENKEQNVPSCWSF